MGTFFKKHKVIFLAELEALLFITVSFIFLFVCLWLLGVVLGFLGLDTKDKQMMEQLSFSEFFGVIGVLFLIYLVLHLHAHFIILYHALAFALRKIPVAILSADHKSIAAEQRNQVAVIWRFTTSPFGSIGCYPWIAFVPESRAKISVSKLPWLGPIIVVILLGLAFLIFETGTWPFILACVFCFLYFCGYLLQILSTLQSFEKQWKEHGATHGKWPFK